MIFKQFFEPESSTYTYLLGCEETKQAVLIDTVGSEIDSYIEQLEKNGLKLIYTLETHVHADHITAADPLRKKLGCKSVMHQKAAPNCVDLSVTNHEHLKVGSIDIEVRYTPGHTNGCTSYFCNNMIFTGDTLLIGGCGRTDFQMGDAGQLFDSIHNQIFQLPDDTLIYPGHDYNGKTRSTVGHEKRHNARLGNNKSREDFIVLMSKLKLDYPKQIDKALPANEACGRVDSQQPS